MKHLILASLLFSLTTQAQNVVTATKTQEGLDLCYFKQLQLKGYAYANLIGRCAWDPAMNGMQLTLIAMPEDPTEDGQKIELDTVRDVARVQTRGNKVEVTLVQDTLDAEGSVIQKRKLLEIRSLNPKTGTFRIQSRSR